MCQLISYNMLLIFSLILASGCNENERASLLNCRKTPSKIRMRERLSPFLHNMNGRSYLPTLTGSMDRMVGLSQWSSLLKSSEFSHLFHEHNRDYLPRLRNLCFCPEALKSGVRTARSDGNKYCTHKHAIRMPPQSLLSYAREANPFEKP